MSLTLRLTYLLSYFKREEPGHSHHQNKAKTTFQVCINNFNSATHSQSSGLLQKAWVTSLALPPATHIACLPGSGWLCSTLVAVIDGHPIVLESLRYWSLLLQLGCTFTNNLS